MLEGWWGGAGGVFCEVFFSVISVRGNFGAADRREKNSGAFLVSV